MRSDMYKVIHDIGRGSYPARIKRSLQLVDGDSLEPVRQNMRYARGLSNRGMPSLRLQPLRRFIASRVGQPWADVHSEIRRTLRRLDASLYDPLLFLGVEVNTSIVNDQVVAHSKWGGLHPVDTECDFYVHPRTQLLCRSNRVSRAQLRRQNEQEHMVEASKRRHDVSDDVQLHLIHGAWFEVRLAPLPSQEQRLAYERCDWAQDRFLFEVAHPLDVVMQKRVWGPDFERERLYGKPGVYAKTKRQLSRTELKAYGLQHSAP